MYKGGEGWVGQMGSIPIADAHLVNLLKPQQPISTTCAGHGMGYAAVHTVDSTIKVSSNSYLEPMQCFNSKY